jgi:hypothetical protein
VQPDRPGGRRLERGLGTAAVGLLVLVRVLLLLRGVVARMRVLASVLRRFRRVVLVCERVVRLRLWPLSFVGRAASVMPSPC